MKKLLKGLILKEGKRRKEADWGANIEDTKTKWIT